MQHVRSIIDNQRTAVTGDAWGIGNSNVQLFWETLTPCPHHVLVSWSRQNKDEQAACGHISEAYEPIEVMNSVKIDPAGWWSTKDEIFPAHSSGVDSDSVKSVRGLSFGRTAWKGHKPNPFCQY